jgi:hypothetical protein
MSTNVTSAVLLMVTGDVLAQEIEMHCLDQPSTTPGAPTVSGGGEDRHGLEDHSFSSANKLHYRRYGTLSPDVRAVHDELHRRKTKVWAEHDFALTAFEQLQVKARTAMLTIESEIESIDLFRCSTMALWSGFLSTPSFILLYRVFDRMLPASSPAAIAARVGITFLMSIPVNTAFFCYGTFIHHVTEWAGLIQEWRHEVPDASVRQVLRHVPFDLPMFWSSARLKIETELTPTVLASAAVWYVVVVVG